MSFNLGQGMPQGKPALVLHELLRKLRAWSKVKLCVKQGKQGLVALFRKFSVHSSLTMSTLLEEWIAVTLASQLTIQGARISPRSTEVTILMSGHLSIMTTVSRTTSKPIGISQFSRTGGTQSPPSFKLISTTCRGSMIPCYKELSQRLNHLESLTYWVYIRIGTLSWLHSSMPPLGEVEMDLIQHSILKLKATALSSRSRKFQPSLALLPMTFIERQ
jgi:hypothetical protein